MNRLYLMSVILLCCLFTCKNAFSITWKEVFKEATFEKKDESILLKLQCYDYEWNDPNPIYYISKLDIKYSENGKDFTTLLRTEMKLQKSTNPYLCMKISYK